MWIALKAVGKWGVRTATIFGLTSTYADYRDGEIRLAEKERWKFHDEKDQVLMERLGELKTSLSKIDDRTEFLYRNEINKAKQEK